MRFFLLVTYLVSFGIRGQEYDAHKISEALKDNADAVVRYNYGKFEVLNISKARYSVKAVITILNEDGNHNALVGVNYDKLSSVSNLSATKYDAKGIRIFRAKSSDFIDESATSGGTFFDDNRVKGIDLRQKEFPYTIEYEYDVNYKFLYFIPKWYFYSGPEESTEYSKFELISPTGLAPRFLSVNTNDPTFLLEKEKEKYTWEAENLPPMEVERYGPSFSEIAPHIMSSPSIFEFDGYKGDLSTWEGFAKWQNKLNEGRDDLSQQTALKLREMTKGLSDKEKVEVIYDYLQSNTRYVSVQLGIGGFQPFPASVVEEEGYGDCKALSFYTKSMLKEVGIDAYYSIAYGGHNPPMVNKDFPSPSYFNHVILCVPLASDTTWLECTSQTNPFGYLGSFTSDRDVLVVNDVGGKIVRTPKYSIGDNQRVSIVTVMIEETGNATLDIHNTYSGLEYEFNGVDYFSVSGKDQQQKWLENRINIPSFSVLDFEFQNKKGSKPQVDLKAQLEVNRLTSNTGSRLFFQPNLMNRNTFIPNRDSEREQDIHVTKSFIEIDTVSYLLPSKFYVEAFFDPIDISTEFGEYKASMKAKTDGTIVYTRTYKQFQGIFDKSKYQDYMNFHKQVVRADKKRVSLKKQT